MAPERHERVAAMIAQRHLGKKLPTGISTDWYTTALSSPEARAIDSSRRP